jgi:hypothetical protein
MALSVDPARAEAALNERLGDKRAQLGESIAKLAKAREDMRRGGLTPTAVGQLYMRAHDLKSLGTMCGFPVVSRLATAVCTLFDDASHLPADQMGLVDDHLDAIRALFDRDVAAEDDPRAAPLLADLERDLRDR